MAREKLTKKQLEKKQEERRLKVNAYKKELSHNLYKRFEIKVRKDTETDIIEHLSSKPSVQAYIKELIRKDIESNERN